MTADIIERLQFKGGTHVPVVTTMAEAADEIARLRADNAAILAALQDVVANVLEYERINKLHPNPGRKYCWDSVERACSVIARVEGRDV